MPEAKDAFDKARDWRAHQITLLDPKERAEYDRIRADGAKREQEKEKQQAELAKERKQQVGTGDRSEKIRTYNFPQNRLTDHRIGLTNHQLAEVMEGKLQPTIDALTSHYQAERLKSETADIS